MKGRICNFLDWITSELHFMGPFRQRCSPLKIGLALLSPLSLVLCVADVIGVTESNIQRVLLRTLVYTRDIMGLKTLSSLSPEFFCSKALLEHVKQTS